MASRAHQVLGIIHSLVVSPLATEALWEMLTRTDASSGIECAGGSANLGTSALPPSGLVAVGVTCSYFILDCLVLFFYARECEVRASACVFLSVSVHTRRRHRHRRRRRTRADNRCITAARAGRRSRAPAASS